MRLCLEKLLWHILNLSYAEDPEVLTSSTLWSEEEGSFCICMSFQESVKQLLKHNKKSQVFQTWKSVPHFYCGERKEILQQERLLKTAARARQQSSNPAPQVERRNKALIPWYTPKVRHIFTFVWAWYHKICCFQIQKQMVTEIKLRSVSSLYTTYHLWWYITHLIS